MWKNIKSHLQSFQILYDIMQHCKASHGNRIKDLRKQGVKWRNLMWKNIKSHLQTVILKPIDIQIPYDIMLCCKASHTSIIKEI